MTEERESKRPTHRAYSVIRREGQDDLWLNLGLVFPHKDGNGFSIMLQALPLDGKIICRDVAAGENALEPLPVPSRPKQNGPVLRRAQAIYRR